MSPVPGRGRTTGRLGRVLVATAVLVGVLAARDVGAPSTTSACSCVPWPESVAAYRTDAQVRVLSGTVVTLAGERGTFAIERVFKGPVPGPVMAIDGGEPGMCGLGLKVGLRLVMATWTDGDVLQPSSCMPSAVLPSPEGNALLADAEASYGGLAPPDPAPVDATTPPVASPGPATADLALPLAIGAAVAVTVLLFGGLIVLSRRRPQGRDA